MQPELGAPAPPAFTLGLLHRLTLKASLPGFSNEEAETGKLNGLSKIPSSQSPLLVLLCRPPERVGEWASGRVSERADGGQRTDGRKVKPLAEESLPGQE